MFRDESKLDGFWLTWERWVMGQDCSGSRLMMAVVMVMVMMVVVVFCDPVYS